MEIRVATINDWQGIAQLMLLLQNQHAEQFPDIFKKNAKRDRVYFERLFEASDRRIFVAVNRNEIIGFIKGKIIHEPESQTRKERTYGYMDSIYIKQDYRGFLIDQLLFKALFEWFRLNHISYAEGGVWEFNNSARLVFEKMGSKTFQRKQRLYI